MKPIETDALIVGSGFGAAAPALRLARAGLQVTVLEKGPNIDAPGDFRQTQDPSYLLKYFQSLTGDNVGMTYIEGLGGGSGFYEMVSLRAPSPAFDLMDTYGRRLWPKALTRHALDPYYEMAERMLNVHQIPPERVPKSGLVFSRMMKNLGYSCDRAAYAIRGCLGSGFCVSGCIYGAKQSLHMNYIPQAKEAGAVYRTGVEALRIRALRTGWVEDALADVAKRPARYEIDSRSIETGRTMRYRARLLILAGGTVGTAKLLLASRRSLPGLSDAVGKQIAFNGGVKMAGLLGPDWPDGDMFSGQSHPGMVSYHFLKSHGITIQAAKPLPLQAIAAARLRMDGDGRHPLHWGRDHMDLMRQYRRRVIVIFALGLTPPTAQLELVHGKPKLRLKVTDELRSYYRRTKKLLNDIYLRNGCQPLDVEFVDSKGMAREDIFFSTSHQLGSCPMADSKNLGVVDATGEAFDLPGLYVTDGAAIPGSIAVSTSLTILANAERIAAGILARHRARERAPVVAVADANS